MLGEALGRSRGKLWTAGAIALLVVSVDFVLSSSYEPYTTRGIAAVVAIAVYLGLARGDADSLGLRLRPRQGYRYWVRVTATIAGGMAVVLVAVFGIWYLLAGPPPIYTAAPGEFHLYFLHSCVAAPLVEEAIYRLVLCVPLVRLLGPWSSIAASGVLFAGLHVVYGNPSPENLLGGFVLAWAFVKSESLTVPLLWHALGNLVVLGGQVMAWYVV